MQSLFDFLIEPVNGKRYANTALVSGVELYVSSSVEDHKTTQRQANVLAVPRNYNGPISVGDTVIVHHNVFRKFYNMQGRESQSSGYVREGVFLASEQEIYMRKSCDKWEAVYPYIFVTPVKSEDPRKQFKDLYGVVQYSCSEDIPPGTCITFEPESEYEFKIDGELMYRMYLKNVTTIQ